MVFSNIYASVNRLSMDFPIPANVRPATATARHLTVKSIIMEAKNMAAVVESALHANPSTPEVGAEEEEEEKVEEVVSTVEDEEMEKREEDE